VPHGTPYAGLVANKFCVSEFGPLADVASAGFPIRVACHPHPQVLNYDFIGDEKRRKKMELDALLTVSQRDATYVFRYLLVFVAALESFSHGEKGLLSIEPFVLGVVCLLASRERLPALTQHWLWRFLPFLGQGGQSMYL
jgi:hypothetical protein